MHLTRNYTLRNSSWNAPYTFSGKEKDAETGYGYFGARYYDSGLSIWLSVDPMSDKYPSMSPYNYCANNPVILVDPDGNYFILPKGTSTKNIYLVMGYLQKLTDDKLVYSTQEDGTIRIKIASLGNGDKTAGTNLIRKINSSKKKLIIDCNNSQGFFRSSYDEGNICQALQPDKMSSTGSDCFISFDVLNESFYPIFDPNTGTISDQKTPREISLGHELIHALHYMTGQYIPGDVDSYKDMSGIKRNIKTETDELRTVGLFGTKPGDITENQLRKELHLKLRGAY